MTMRDPTEFMLRRRQLADALRGLREQAGRSAYRLAADLGWSQSKISKIENAQISVKVPDAQAMAEALGAPPERLARITELAELAQQETVTFSQVQRHGGVDRKQRQIAALERTARRLRYFAPTGMPGLLQVPGYTRLAMARFLASETKIAAAINARLERQQILFDRSRRFEFVLSEQVIRWRQLPIPQHLAQLDRIATVSGEPHVRLGIIPWTRLAPVWHLHAFQIFSERPEEEETIVSFESLGAENIVSENSDPERVARFLKAFEELKPLAVYDEEARALLSRVGEELRQLGD